MQALQILFFFLVPQSQRSTGSTGDQVDGTSGMIHSPATLVPTNVAPILRRTLPPVSHSSSPQYAQQSAGLQH